MEFKNGENILLGFQTTEAQSRALLAIRPKIALFDPLGGVGEMSGQIIEAPPMTEPLVYIFWPASPRLLSAVYR